jgi:hypothetical protein
MCSGCGLLRVRACGTGKAWHRACAAAARVAAAESAVGIAGVEADVPLPPPLQYYAGQSDCQAMTLLRVDGTRCQCLKVRRVATRTHACCMQACCTSAMTPSSTGRKLLGRPPLLPMDPREPNHSQLPCGAPSGPADSQPESVEFARDAWSQLCSASSVTEVQAQLQKDGRHSADTNTV